MVENHRTNKGSYYIGNSENILKTSLGKEVIGKVQLIITSPPFPLNQKKKYGNLLGEEYKKWLTSFAPIFSKLLKEDGSIILELGNGWEKGRPIQSLLTLETLIEFVKNKDANLRLCQEFICYNPARLPSPASWVTIQRIRLTDSFTHVWWMAKNDYPKADNSKVLRPYSKSMKNLIKTGKYNSGKRPSGHNISSNSFSKDNKGSIAQNFFEIEKINENDDVRLPNAFRIPNTNSNDNFSNECRKRNIIPHPARMPLGLISFFINFLTDEGDIVFDPFAGSNSTGYVSEILNRRWYSIEINDEYSEQAKIRMKPII